MKYYAIISFFCNQDFGNAANVIEQYKPVLTESEYLWLKSVWGVV